MPEHLWGQANALARQIKALWENGDLNDDAAAVRLGKSFRKTIEARRRVKRKIYPGEEMQWELVQLCKIVRRLTQAQLAAVSCVDSLLILG